MALSKRVDTANEFYANERKAYQNLPFAFHRENTQNSIDGDGRRGASRIAYTVDSIDDNTVRIEVADNGPGMTRDTIDNVFMKLGKTTKAGSETATGGFGRARVLTHFGMHCYLIDTQDSHVVGVGGEYGIKDRHNRYNGCRMTIYAVATDRYGYKIDWTHELRSFLSLAQLDAQVTVNGERFTNWCYRRQKTRDLTFGAVHVNYSSERKGLVIVRVNGVPMFTDTTSADAQVIIEIAPSISREVLTSNRDGLTSKYHGEYQSFLREISQSVEALEENLDEIIEVTGTGTFTHSRKDSTATLVEDFGFGIDGEHSQYPKPENVVAILNPVREVVEPVRPSYRKDSPSLPSVVAGTGVPRLSDIPESQQIEDDFRAIPTATAVEDYQIDPSQTDDDRGTEVEEPAQCKKTDGRVEIDAKARNRLFSIIINDRTRAIKDEDARRRLRKQIASYNPDNWKVIDRPGQGKTFSGGSKAKLLLAWKTICHFVIDEYAKLVEQDNIQWGVGWLFDRAAITSEARERNEVFYLLLNPLDDRGAMKYGISSQEDWNRLIVGAVHQVTHLREKYHCEDFASLNGTLTVAVINRLPEIKKTLRKISKVRLV